MSPARTARTPRPLVAAALVAAAVTVGSAGTAAALDPPGATVFVNEIHYDNDGTDTGEAIEVRGPAGTDLTGWTIVRYNGSNGTAYGTDPLPSPIPDLGGGTGVVVVDYPVNGLQNGSPDGVALVDAGGAVVQFLSYEGSFTAVGGPADGLTSTDIGVAEASSTPVGQSLQLTGTGSTPGELTWSGPAAATFGALNGGGAPTADVDVTEFHYDNDGADTGEAIEVTAAAGTDLAGWTIELYNGNGGAPYGTVALSGVVPDEAGGLGAVAFGVPGLQNGSPDGFALVAPDGSVDEFWSYEGVIVAVGGPADGLTSVDVGVSEPSSTPIGQSLQLVDGAWVGPALASFGLLNDTPTAGTCPDAPAVTRIHDVQGPGAATPCGGEDVVVEGVVVADYEGPSPNLRGFYVQEEDTDVDADPATSEALFVFNGNDDDVDLGDVVRVAGTAGEFQGQTQISSVTDITVVSTGASVTPAVVTLPVASPDSLEAFEGMAVTFPQELYVTEFFQLGRFGQVVVSSGDRLDQPTAVAEPGADANAVQAANDLNRLIIDDTTNDQNPEPIIYGGNGAPLTAANPLRGGDVTVGATGVLTYTWAGNSASGNAYRLRPAGDPIEFTTANPRPAEVPDVGGSMQVASFNVLNYFLTLDDNSPACGPVGAKDECRGAESVEEFERQRAKLLDALAGLDADVIGLVELENTELADGTPVEPLADIVAGLNDLAATERWAYVDTGAIGTDVIKVGLIHRTDTVAPVGGPAVLDSSVDPRFDDTRNRPALAHSFVETATGEVLTVVVNHLKSKGCGGSTGADVDQGDGQGCFNASRTSAAEALVDWVAGHPTGIADDDVLVIGDLNSYAKEDPIDVFVAAGYVDLAPAFDPEPYSYVFDGQWGYLDYALASPSLVAQVTGAAEYHINADEVPVLDYNTNFQSPTQVVDLYAPDRFRTSDHDPVLVGLALDAGPQGRVFALPSVLWPANGRLRNVVVLGIGERWGLLDTTIVDVTSSEADDGLSPKDRPGDVEIVSDRRLRLRAEAFDPAGRTYVVTVRVDGDGQVRFDSETVHVFPRRGWFW